MTERLTREQMAEKYPNQWLGINNIEYDEDNTTLLKADVVIINKTKEELKSLQFSNTGIVAWGTYEDSGDALGAIGLQV